MALLLDIFALAEPLSLSAPTDFAQTEKFREFVPHWNPEFRPFSLLLHNFWYLFRAIKLYIGTCRDRSSVCYFYASQMKATGRCFPVLILFKTESTRTLSTKILYQKNLKHIALFLFFKGWRCNRSSVITPKKFLMAARENGCQIFPNYILQMNFWNFTFIITIRVKFNIYFLGLPWKIIFGVTTDDLLHLS